MADLNLPNFLAVVNYPHLGEHDQKFIDFYRKANDVYYDLIPAHFSFVFPVFDMEKKEFMAEVRKQATGFPTIEYKLRCAIRNNDRTSDYWHVLLVPDQGFSEIVKLHSKLYSGLFKPYERLDLDFIPHMGIANSKDPKECKRMVDEVNAMEIDIRGTIEQLDIVEHVDGVISSVDAVRLS